MYPLGERIIPAGPAIMFKSYLRNFRLEYIIECYRINAACNMRDRLGHFYLFMDILAVITYYAVWYSSN